MTQRDGDDCEKFDKAFEKNDIKEFVRLLSSFQKIDALEDRMHPWAKDPETVGALSATQLAILASNTESESNDHPWNFSTTFAEPEYREQIRTAGGIPPLVDYLKSPVSEPFGVTHGFFV